MSDLVENGLVSQQPTQAAFLNGPQQLQQSHQPKPASSSAQQSLALTGEAVANSLEPHQTLESMSKVDSIDYNQVVDPNSASSATFHKQQQGYQRGGGSSGRHTQSQRHHNNMSRQQYYPHQQHHSSKHNVNNNHVNNLKGDNESNINHVLLITVINPHYPITCELIHQICSNYGKVNRIVIFKKNGVQAMVEFDNIESAKRAKSLLHGCDIYSGCCTLRIEYAKPTRLNVHRNDSESFDYTNSTLGSSSGNDEHDQQHHNHAAQHPHHSHSHHHQHHQVAGHHHAYPNNPAMHQHQRAKSGPSMNMANRREVGRDMSGVGADGGHHTHDHPPHHQHSNQFQQKQAQSATVPPNSTGHQDHHPHHYGVSQPTSAEPGFQQQSEQPQQEGFGVSRASNSTQPTGPSAVVTTGGQPQPPPPGSYIGVEPFAMGAAAHGSHGMHEGGVFTRHDNQHTPNHHHHNPQHHHHQPHRMGGGSGASGGLNHHHHHPHHHSAYASQNAALMAGPSGMFPQGTVMMVYGLNLERVNCDRLFNLFCLYGNVVRVKFLRTKEGCAMVQMGDVLAVDRCVSSLNKITLFGNELQISYSKQAFLHDVIRPFMLPDGSPSFKDFMGNQNNRFKNPEVASKNRILPPSQVLHFFNAPFGISEDELLQVFRQTAGHESTSLKIFTPKTENTKSHSGLITFRDPIEATEALVLCNHLSMPRSGAPHPYILRLCFSPPTYTKHNQQQGAAQEAASFATGSGTQLSNASTNNHGAAATAPAPSG